MNIEEALVVLDTFLEHGLSDVQEIIFRQAWEGQTYPDIAESCGYDANYIKDVGSKLWKLLSQAFGEEVTKSNFRSVLRRRSLRLALPTQNNVLSEKVQIPTGLRQSQSTSKVKDVIPGSSLVIEKQQDRQTPVLNSDLLEIPGGSVPLNSFFYIERPPIEERAYTEINKSGSLIRIKAPSKMGKTSLMHRILAHAKQTGVHTVQIGLQRADSQVFTSLEKFLRWFCANVTRQLNLEIRLDDYWDEDIGSKVSCTLYLQEYLLEKIEAPVVLALDEVNRIFEYPEISRDFLPLLRSWYEDASELDIWQKLRLVVVHATEAYIPLDIHQSPFNVGLPIKLPEFSLEQMQELAVRHGLDWAKGEKGLEKLAPLLAMIGGHPYLVRLALYNLGNQTVSLEQLLQEAPTIAGIYSNYLRHHLANLQEHPELATALKRVVTSPTSVQLEAIAAYKLESMGLVKLEGNQAMSSCELYQLYFREQLA
ncbi:MULTISPECIES: AAA-like domain-containing protein [Nostoc]|uniref:AAA-like domain-containing protein n=1 Tax=Nostoc paludosum FACHB-159 TaxID=2692908 RepID=A0ABR8K6K1_9NOSO|nr:MULTISPECIES: AAA-like domain-containing protein [Nostoc]MBD2678141.1 AAA-like domain-containing protein [Nostoc sp. FACHB-857]MBD2734401.1 AAA-like domain-containing protein [Nostoc paludosum FACHB-159]